MTAMYIAVRKEEKNKCHFQAHFPSSIVRKANDLHGVHCAILSSDSITHKTLPGMRKDPRISQMPTVARHHRRLLLFLRQSNARCSKCFSRQFQISKPIISKQKPFIYKLDDVMAHLNLFCQKRYR